jgi:hypothetical protein
MICVGLNIYLTKIKHHTEIKLRHWKVSFKKFYSMCKKWRSLNGDGLNRNC